MAAKIVTTFSTLVRSYYIFIDFFLSLCLLIAYARSRRFATRAKWISFPFALAENKQFDLLVPRCFVELVLMPFTTFALNVCALLSSWLGTSLRSC